MTQARSHRLTSLDSDPIYVPRKGEALAIVSNPLRCSGSFRTATILLVEDDPVLAHLFERILVSEEFAARVCRNGMEALLLLQDEATSVDVVLSDVRLPLLTGDRLASEIGRIRPGLPVLLMTGFSETVTADNADILGVAAVLQKPLSARQLLSAVHAALAGARKEDRQHRSVMASGNLNAMK
jgi:two-component system cell cycle sensor histidine kinase/response regulator CckA